MIQFLKDPRGKQQDVMVQPPFIPINHENTKVRKHDQIENRRSAPRVDKAGLARQVLLSLLILLLFLFLILILLLILLFPRHSRFRDQPLHPTVNLYNAVR